MEKLNKSILDYIIIRKDDITKIKEAIIDEEKIMAPAKIMSEGGQTRTVFSDHKPALRARSKLETPSGPGKAFG